MTASQVRLHFYTPFRPESFHFDALAAGRVPSRQFFSFYFRSFAGRLSWLLDRELNERQLFLSLFFFCTVVVVAAAAAAAAAAAVVVVVVVVVVRTGRRLQLRKSGERDSHHHYLRGDLPFSAQGMFRRRLTGRLLLFPSSTVRETKTKTKKNQTKNKQKNVDCLRRRNRQTFPPLRRSFRRPETFRRPKSIFDSI